MVRLGSFVEALEADHNDAQCGYIAQHTILDQIPELRQDMPQPDYLCAAEEEIRTHFFFGPKGTVTPLHYDPYHNVLVQVVGYKYIRLYSPEHSVHLAPRDGMANNTSLPKDILTAEKAAFPHEFLTLPYWEAVLGPGDVLYLPLRYWHFVKSLSISISVAFHFM